MNWLPLINLKDIFDLIPSEFRQESSVDCIKELDASKNKAFARKRFYKININRSNIIHLTYGYELHQIYKNSKELHKIIPNYTCKPLFLKNIDDLFLFGQDFFEGGSIDDLYNESRLEEVEVTKILATIFRIFKKLEQPSSIESAQEEFKEFCDTILHNKLLSEIDFHILENEVFPIISSWIDKANPTIRLSQGDLSARNILVNKQKDFRIIDCEFACKTHFHQEDWFRLSSFSEGKFCEHPFFKKSLKKNTLALNLIHLLKQTHLNSRVHTSNDYLFYLKKDLFNILLKTYNFENPESFFHKSFFTYYNLLNVSLDQKVSDNERLIIENKSSKELTIISDHKNLKLSNQLIISNQQIDELKSKVKISNQQIDDLKCKVKISNQQIDDLKNQVSIAETKIINLNHNSLDLQKSLESKEDKILRMKNSFSWKITVPIRFLRRQKERLFQPSAKQKNPVGIKPESSSSNLGVTDEPSQIFSPFESLENFPNPNQSNTNKIYDPKCLKIIWLIPDFGKGSGGHSNIFRMIHFLEIFGHENTILICGKTQYGSPEKAKKVLCDNFFKINAEVQCLLNPNDFKHDGDALICTSYDTCYYGRSLSFNGKRFYFVQDFEPDFSPKGSYYYLAKETYKFGLECITNGKWMAEKVLSEGGKCAGWFQQAFDPLYYYPHQNKNYHNKKIRIAAYIRFGTPRRLSELIIFALNILAKERNDFEVMFFGDNQLPFNANFPNKILGVLSHSRLGVLYRSCDIGCVFSGTNYSLIPIEMMAAGLPVIEFDGENIRSTFPSKTICLAKPNPESIKRTLSYLIANPKIRQIQAEEALNFVMNFSWHNSAKSVEKALLNVISSQNESQCYNSNA